MSFLVGEIVAVVRADTKQFKAGMAGVRSQGAATSASVNKNLNSIGTTLKGMAPLVAAGLTIPLVQGARKAIREFAELEGATDKFNVVFGEYTDEMNRWMSSIRENLPLSRREITQHAAALQDLLVPMGVTRKEATTMTQEWIELAGALSAFNDVPVDQALEAIRSGLAGQSEPLRRFGIDARQTAIQQTALANGLIRAGEEMDEQTRLQALLIRAYDQSEDALNGLEAQMGSTLWKEQELQAVWKDTLSLIGEDLQPQYVKLVETLTDFLLVASALNQIMDDLNADSDSWGKNLLDILNPISTLGEKAGDAIAEFGGKLVESIKFSRQLRGVLSGMNEGMSQTAEETEDVNNSLTKLSFTLEEMLSAYNKAKKDIENSPLIDNKTAEMLDYELKKIEQSLKDFSFDTGEFFEVGSIARIQQEMRELEEQLIRTSDPERIATLNQEISVLENKLSEMRELGINEQLENTTQAAKYFSRTLADGLDQVLFQARSVEDAIKGIIRQLASRALTTGILGLFGGGFGAGGFLGAMFGGARASGGPVNSGKTYLVGERGPELFTPSQSGSIIPNGDNSKNINLTVNVQGKLTGSGTDLEAIISETVRQQTRLQ